MTDSRELKESEVLELKSIYTPEIKRTIISFANTKGGVIYIGIQDKGAVCGVENPDFVMQQITNSIKDGIKPDLLMFVSVEQEKINDFVVIKITVLPGNKKPYYLKDKGLKPNGVFVRVGSSTNPASEDAIRMLIKQSDGEIFEQNRAFNQDLTFNVLAKELQTRNINFSKPQKKSIGIINDDNEFTNLGLLVSDQCLHSIKFAVFQGKDKLDFRDRKEFTGSIFSQLEEVYKIIDFYNATSARFNKLYRMDVRDYPEDAVREVLLNAIVHRDYSISGSTFVNLYSNRLEVISLGSLVPDLSLEAAMIGVSKSRNEGLAHLFYRMKLIEAYGTGIGKVLASYKEINAKPEFENIDRAFRVILPNQSAHQVLAEEVHEPRINEYLKDKKIITRTDIERAYNVGTTQALNILKQLQADKIIKRTGKGKNTRYIKL